MIRWALLLCVIVPLASSFPLPGAIQHRSSHVKHADLARVRRTAVQALGRYKDVQADTCDAVLSRRTFVSSSVLPLSLLLAFIPSTAHAMGWLTKEPAALASAAANLPADVLASGIVEVDRGADLERVMDERMALYVTARVGPRGPVLASIRIPQPKFPLEFEMRESDVYASGPEEQKKLADKIRAEDLVIAARLDKDGQASTRGPEDLVAAGRVYKFGSDQSAQWSRAVLELRGRGAFGEFVTNKSREP